MLPGWHVEAVEDVNFLAPFKFYRNEPRTLTVEAMLHPSGDNVVADCRLIGQRTLPNQAEPQITTHFTGRVRLTEEADAARTCSPRRRHRNGSVVEAADIYRLYFHGPAYQVMDRAWWDGNRSSARWRRDLPDQPSPV